MQDDLSTLTDKIEKIWKNINSAPPKWLELAARDLFDESFIESLKLKRDTLLRDVEIERKQKKRRRKEKKVAEEAQNRLLAELAREREIEEEEFRRGCN